VLPFARGAEAYTLAHSDEKQKETWDFLVVCCFLDSDQSLGNSELISREHTQPMWRTPLIRVTYVVTALLLLAPIFAAFVGRELGPGLLHPQNLNPARVEQTAEMLNRTGATKIDFLVHAPDGVELHGWKVRARSSSGNWILLFHGVSDNRTGVLGHAELLLRHGYDVVMMDARAQGTSGGETATYGWKERYDTVAITNELLSTEKVNHLGALGVSMGAAIALQSAAVEPRIEA
jgi:pimeloyl-ACP methyl ester carboxylesterase